MLAVFTITIAIGWWILPAIITAVLGVLLIIIAAGDTKGIGAGLNTILFFMFAFGVSSFSWLIWALFR